MKKMNLNAMLSACYGCIVTIARCKHKPTDLAEAYQVTKSTISAISTGRNWSHVKLGDNYVQQ